MQSLVRSAAGALAITLVTLPNADAHGPAVVIGAPPVVAAPPVVIAPQAPYPYVWQPGYWAWNGYGRTWIEGRWVLAASPRPAPYPYHRGWERRDWHHAPHGPYGAPYWGHR
jgi:hypothetical protein